MDIATTIRSVIHKNHRIFFFGGLLLLNLIQAGKTELFDDEAYYWVYSNYSAWGYFDHPPMVAILIKAGYFFFRNEFGVRLMTVLISTATLIIVQHLLPKKNDPLFYALVFCIAIFQVGGFIAIPDIPLLFFIAVFFWVYRKFIQHPTLYNCLLLGSSMALMSYCKYQAVLVIFFTLTSYPKLFKNYHIYVAAGVALLLFLPHLYWQYSHDFISLQYHLIDRYIQNQQYSFSYILDYLAGQFLLAGPLAAPLLLWAVFMYHPKDYFEKALLATIVGTYVFFLLVSLKGRVEANWTTPVLVPMILLCHQYFSEKKEMTKWIFRLGKITFLLVLLLRIAMISEVPLSRYIKNNEIHGNRQWVEAIQQKAKGMPVLFTDSYQFASKYWFYSGHPSFSLNTPLYRRNNYNLWPHEDAYLQKTIYMVGGFDSAFLKDSIVSEKGLQGGAIIPHYLSFSQIKISPQKRIFAVDGIAKDIRIDVYMNERTRKYITSTSSKSFPIQLWIWGKGIPPITINTFVSLDQMSKTENDLTISFPFDLPAGKYLGQFNIPTIIPKRSSINSSFVIVNAKGVY
jgi:hypothetical protein